MIFPHNLDIVIVEELFPQKPCSDYLSRYHAHSSIRRVSIPGPGGIGQGLRALQVVETASGENAIAEASF